MGIALQRKQKVHLPNPSPDIVYRNGQPPTARKEQVSGKPPVGYQLLAGLASQYQKAGISARNVKGSNGWSCCSLQCLRTSGHEGRSGWPGVVRNQRPKKCPIGGRLYHLACPPVLENKPSQYRVPRGHHVHGKPQSNTVAPAIDLRFWPRLLWKGFSRGLRHKQWDETGRVGQPKPFWVGGSPTPQQDHWGGMPGQRGRHWGVPSKVLSQRLLPPSSLASQHWSGKSQWFCLSWGLQPRLQPPAVSKGVLHQVSHAENHGGQGQNRKRICFGSVGVPKPLPQKDHRHVDQWGAWWPLPGDDVDEVVCGKPNCHMQLLGRWFCATVAGQVFWAEISEH